MSNLSAARVLVVGDLILDRYWHGASRRISPEAPVPVVLVDDIVERVGGAANVAANIAALGSETVLIGVLGNDADGRLLTHLCVDQGITTDFVSRDSERTIVKLRVVSQGQQLVRLDFENPSPNSHSGDVLSAVERHLPQVDFVVISDYAKGALNQVEQIIAAARAAAKPVLVDPKRSDFSAYAGATLVTPNLNEFEAVVGRCESEQTLVAKAEELIETHDFGALLVTRGATGMSLVKSDGSFHHIAAEAQEVFDVTGAGDTVCGVLAAGLASGMDLLNATQIANTAASLVVGKFGSATVSYAEIERATLDANGQRLGVMTRSEILEEITLARRRGERIVMTNGCFDLLHAGHVQYLQTAKNLGHRLVVAVNDDDSVRRLKGADRPINAVDSRMQVLAALSAVDWVVAFDSDTPRELIVEILPDVLVKGGDYQVDDIVGAAEVKAAGGEVLVVDYLEGHSSSTIIQRLSSASESES